MLLLNQTLYHIREEHIRLIDLVEQAEGELSPDLYEAIQLNEKDLQECAISYGYVIRQYEDTEELIAKEIDRLQALKERAHKRREVFKGMIVQAMTAYKINRIESPTLKLFFRKSKAVQINDERLIPSHYYEMNPVLSKTKIREAIDAGLSVPGAGIVERQNLQVK